MCEFTFDFVALFSTVTGVSLLSVFVLLQLRASTSPQLATLSFIFAREDAEDMLSFLLLVAGRCVFCLTAACGLATPCSGAWQTETYAIVSILHKIVTFDKHVIGAKKPSADNLSMVFLHMMYVPGRCLVHDYDLPISLALRVNTKILGACTC